MKTKRMKGERVARTILEVLKEHSSPFKTLRDLAKESGFKGAHRKDFKTGLNLLIKKGIIEVRHSGWQSEQGGQRGHQKGVVLLCSISDFQEEDVELSHEKETAKKEISDENVLEKLVEIKTLDGDPSYIKESDYTATKNDKKKVNFWLPACA